MGDPSEQMAEVLDDLDQASAPKVGSQDGWFEQAMADLLGVEVSLAAGQKVSKEEFAEFKPRVIQRIREQAPMFRFFCARTDSAAEDPRESWYRASLGRSVLQMFIENYQGTGIEELIDFEQLEEIDELLRENASKAPPVVPHLIPPGLPDSHWWWRAPTGPYLEVDEYGDVW